MINETRELIFSTFHKSPQKQKLFFHSGATEVMNTFVHSFSETSRLSGKDLLICFSELDHPAVTSLEERFWGSHVKFMHLKRDKNLRYQHHENFQNLKDKKDNNPNLVILYHHLWVHNETGDVSPLEDLKIFKAIPDLFIHVDGVQAPGKVLGWDKLPVGDIWSFSGHKFGSIKGIGFSLIEEGVPFSPMMSGGGQQSGLRSGTENTMGIKSLGLALNDTKDIEVVSANAKRKDLSVFIATELKDLGSVLEITSPNSNTIYFYLNTVTSDVALALFDLNGLSLSAGSACSSGSAKDSLVLLHTGHKTVAKNGLRLSFNPRLTNLELENIKMKFTKVVQRLRAQT